MKAYLLSGSPNTDGSTITVLELLGKELNQLGFETKIEILDQCNIGFCRGCKRCELDFNCVQRDDMDRIFDNIKKTDLLVLASPSYWGDITAQMKVFIDRCTPLCEYINSQSVPKGKIGISISIRAGKMEAENLHLLECFEHYFGHLNIKPVNRFSLTQVNKKDDLENKKKELSELKDIAIIAAKEMKKGSKECDQK
ncbi:Iron-sulfur flavoprotein [Chitinispirillum alkaliphilum]|nr:Iron-sulfur flavoprotein [Chitinispirillum alkaliphilum]